MKYHVLCTVHPHSDRLCFLACQALAWPWKAHFRARFRDISGQLCRYFTVDGTIPAYQAAFFWVWLNYDQVHHDSEPSECDLTVLSDFAGVEVFCILFHKFVWASPALIYAMILMCLESTTWWYDMIWYDMIWYDIIWYDVIWFDMIWYDMTWYDMMWFDLIWYDMIWFYMIRRCLMYLHLQAIPTVYMHT